MPFADQLNPIVPVAETGAPDDVEKRRSFEWPVIVIALALIGTAAWNCALLWMAVHIYQVMFS
jgi:hypothetical protein